MLLFEIINEFYGIKKEKSNKNNFFIFEHLHKRTVDIVAFTKRKAKFSANIYTCLLVL